MFELYIFETLKTIFFFFGEYFTIKIYFYFVVPWTDN